MNAEMSLNAGLTDRLFLLYWMGLSVAVILQRDRVEAWAAYLALHATLIIMILILVRGRRRWPHAHAWYPLLLPIIAFPEAAQLRDLFVDDWRDRYLLAIEAAVFPEPPTVWLGRFSSILFSEILQAGYLSYFLFLPVVAAVVSARRPHAILRRDGSHRARLPYVLRDLSHLPDRRSGAHAAAFAHAAATGRSLAIGRRVRAESRHTRQRISECARGRAVVPVIFAGRYAARLVPWLLPLLALMGVGAVYDRYHYVSDIIAGAAIGIACAIVVLIVQPNQGRRTHADAQG